MGRRYASAPGLNRSSNPAAGETYAGVRLSVAKIGVSRPNQAVWLAPTPDFRRSAFESRGSTWSIPRRTGDPERALANYLARDHLFTREVVEQATALHLPVVELDGSLAVGEATVLVARRLGLNEPG